MNAQKLTAIKNYIVTGNTEQLVEDWNSGNVEEVNGTQNIDIMSELSVELEEKFDCYIAEYEGCSESVWLWQRCSMIRNVCPHLKPRCSELSNVLKDNPISEAWFKWEIIRLMNESLMGGHVEIGKLLWREYLGLWYYGYYTLERLNKLPARLYAELVQYAQNEISNYESQDAWEITENDIPEEGWNQIIGRFANIMEVYEDEESSVDKMEEAMEDLEDVVRDVRDGFAECCQRKMMYRQLLEDEDIVSKIEYLGNTMRVFAYRVPGGTHCPMWEGQEYYIVELSEPVGTCQAWKRIVPRRVVIMPENCSTERYRYHSMSLQDEDKLRPEMALIWYAINTWRKEHGSGRDAMPINIVNFLT